MLIVIFSNFLKRQAPALILFDKMRKQKARKPFILRAFDIT